MRTVLEPDSDEPKIILDAQELMAKKLKGKVKGILFKYKIMIGKLKVTSQYYAVARRACGVEHLCTKLWLREVGYMHPVEQKDEKWRSKLAQSPSVQRERAISVKYACRSSIVNSSEIPESG
ncbi:hypothetical protein T265_01175 [Opisthorchis viverrini]|uniref:Uncharacterized protein n=1 Tax=Opisthorchis viverrini TaxID=6198 RepID=A0A075A0K3_OPIVI|nr:hypothetical protein T265_01175 [Opisthorchis viverrini]KER32891.1 hypothetical protein T265_01175 [Opisthorchis viverrini]